MGGVVSVAKPVSNVILVELLKHVRPWLKPALTSHCTAVSLALGGGRLANYLSLYCFLGQSALILMVYDQKGVQGIGGVLVHDLSGLVITKSLIS